MQLTAFPLKDIINCIETSLSVPWNSYQAQISAFTVI